MEPLRESEGQEPDPETQQIEETFRAFQEEMILYDSLEDEAHLQRANRAFSDFYRLTRSRVEGAVANRLRALRLHTEEAAEDVVHDVYVRIMRFGTKFRGDASVTTWMHRIAINAANDYQGKESRQVHDVLDEQSLVAPDGTLRPAMFEHPEASAIRSDRRARLAGHLAATLSPILLYALVAHDAYGFSDAELSEMEGSKENVFKVRRHRAKKKLLEEVPDIEEL